MYVGVVSKNHWWAQYIFCNKYYFAIVSVTSVTPDTPVPTDL